MPCDALTYEFVVKELADRLKDGKIDKITMPKHDEVLVFVRKQRTNHILSICAGSYSRIHLTSQTKPAPINAYSFCMNLRKNILGGIITDIKKQPDERVIIISIAFLNELNVREDKLLICEIMGKYSNIILTNTDLKIYECLKHIPIDSPLNRPLLSGLKYTFPTQNKLSLLDKDAILALDELSSANLQERIKGLAPISFSEALFNAKINDLQLSLAQKESLCNELINLFSQPQKPCVHLDSQNQPDEFFVRPYNCLSQNYLFFDTLNEALDHFYTFKEKNLQLSSKVKSLSTIARNALKKCHKRINELSQNYQSALNYTDDKLNGDLITANIYKIKAGDLSLTTPNFYLDNQPVTIALNPLLTPSQNAQKYFKSYSKKKRAIGHINQMLLKSQADVEEYEALLDELSQASDIAELDDICKSMHTLGLIKTHLREKNVPISLPHSYQIEGFLVLAGKNSAQNERLVRQSQPNDLWFHVKNFRGSHVVIRCQNAVIPNSVILKAAQIAAYHSKANQSGKIEVDYTRIKHVTKPSSTPAGNVVYKNHTCIIVSPLLPTQCEQ